MSNSRFDGKALPEAIGSWDVHCVRRDDGSYDRRAMLYLDHADVAEVFELVQHDPLSRRTRFASDEWLRRSTAFFKFPPFPRVQYSQRAGRRQIECTRDRRESSSQQLRKLLFQTFWIELHALPGAGGRLRL